jgi:outer membrane protein assembly factor BamB
VATGTSAAITITTGTVRWTRKADWAAQAAAPGSDRFLVTDKAGLLSSVRVADGHPEWTASAFPSESIAVDRDRVYRVSGHGVEALGATGGKPVWTTRQQADGVQPVAAGGLLYTGGPVLNATDGRPVGPDITGRVIVAGGRIHQAMTGQLRTLG